MKVQRFSLGLIFFTFALITELKAQKKILDHTAYDSWQFIKNQSIKTGIDQVAQCTGIDEGCTYDKSFMITFL